METMLVFGATGLLILMAFANGANDVSKAVATLAGTRIASIRTAILWGTIWTGAGALAGSIWGTAIIKTITESIYTNQDVLNLPQAIAIALSPALWVILATWRKWPVSSTHAIVGGLVGVGLVTAGIDGIAWQTTFSKIIVPLLASPVVAIVLAFLLAPTLEKIASRISKTRVCLPVKPGILLGDTGPSQFSVLESDQCLVCDSENASAKISSGFVLSVNQLHWVTSGLLSFARGLHDTPKFIAIILPIMLLSQMIPTQMSYVIVALAMSAGGLIIGKRVTEVLGFGVTKMTDSQGFSANLIATLLVLVASRFGMPVSTTHVATSSIMGIGLTNGSGINREAVKSILLAWLITAPVAGVFSALIYLTIA